MELAEAVLVTSWLSTEEGIRRIGVLTDPYPLKPLSPVQVIPRCAACTTGI